MSAVHNTHKYTTQSCTCTAALARRMQCSSGYTAVLHVVAILVRDAEKGLIDKAIILARVSRACRVLSLIVYSKTTIKLNKYTI